MEHRERCEDDRRVVTLAQLIDPHEGAL